MAIASTAANAATPATVWQNATLTTGPGFHYETIGNLSPDTPVRVDQCSHNWCSVTSEQGTGWVKTENLDFGRSGDGPWRGEEFGRNFGGSGQVCLYTGTGFSGQVLCGASGFVVRDLDKVQLGDMFSSATVEGNVSVLVCRDRFFHSYCSTLTKDTPDLGIYLKQQVSSIRVY